MILTDSKNTWIPTICSTSPSRKFSTPRKPRSPSAKGSATARMNAPCRIATRSALANLPTHRSLKPSKTINYHLTQVGLNFAHLPDYLCGRVPKSRNIFVTLQFKCACADKRPLNVSKNLYSTYWELPCSRKRFGRLSAYLEVLFLFYDALPFHRLVCRVRWFSPCP